MGSTTFFPSVSRSSSHDRVPGTLVAVCVFVFLLDGTSDFNKLSGISCPVLPDAVSVCCAKANYLVAVYVVGVLVRSRHIATHPKIKTFIWVEWESGL